MSFGVCALDAGEPLFEDAFPSAGLGADPSPLVDAVRAHGPFDLVLGPAGYGLPLVAAADVGERELALIVLKRADEAEAGAGIGGMRSIVRALLAAGIPLVFGPGAIHLPTVPEHRKWNRIDLGTADKVASAALGIVDQASRLAMRGAGASGRVGVAIAFMACPSWGREWAWPARAGAGPAGGTSERAEGGWAVSRRCSRKPPSAVQHSEDTTQ